jgi:hypothetical protein
MLVKRKQYAGSVDTLTSRRDCEEQGIARNKGLRGTRDCEEQGIARNKGSSWYVRGYSTYKLPSIQIRNCISLPVVTPEYALHYCKV